MTRGEFNRFKGARGQQQALEEEEEEDDPEWVDFDPKK